ncbi:phospholipid/cholesterol/gamma-HCH transport system ATP-binding protein [Sphingomonas gellani]|uniref:Phospholipid/cholesterol/gamma-HCH transport system ATP-binding protein n=1 Tax=Sphingomonas gellani TaxID=1166340 RepID=A0A1H8CQK8_9SPHN|nr:ABC transporter ATP-binding protein [Sphingomonas gellani]SEM96724.1 phospholipid/cholesterol/gamma-HCH transport system ATP-binding protein [Sphingomonas gellani]
MADSHFREGADPIITVRGLKNGFGDQIVHDGLDLDVRRGEILGVVGGSGTGKSVLMRSIIGLQTPLAGEITVFGEPTIGREETEAVEIRKRWGVLFQGGALFSTLTVAENVEVPLNEFYRDMDPALTSEIASYKVVMTGLPADAGPKYPAELSGGMKKRAGLARALALDPELLFLDEPTAGLDPIGAAAFDQLTRSLQRTLGLTVFLITHDLDTLYAICDRIAVLADKKVIAVGTIPELLALDHPWIQEYFKGPRGRAAEATQEAQEGGHEGDGPDIGPANHRAAEHHAGRGADAEAAAHPTEVETQQRATDPGAELPEHAARTS